MMNSNIAHYSGNSLPTLVSSAARSFYDELEINYKSAPYHERQHQMGVRNVSGLSKHFEYSKHSVGTQRGVDSPGQEKRVNHGASTSGLSSTLPGGSFVQLLNNDNDKKLKVVMMKDSQTQTDEHPPRVNNDHARSYLSFNSDRSTGLHQCSHCDKAFTVLSKLQTHLRSHTGEKPYPCHICPKRFGYKDHLRKHVKIHTGEKPFMCSVCYKRFIESGSLKRHMRTHTGEKPYPCKLCNKTFSTTSNLTKHIRVHTGERPYKCDQCGKGFRVSGDLKSHYRIHTKEKPYECKVCSKKFSFSHQLKIHTRIHTGEKPYSCEICQRPFSELGSLKRHGKVHMGK